MSAYQLETYACFVVAGLAALYLFCAWMGRLNDEEKRRLQRECLTRDVRIAELEDELAIQRERGGSL